MNRLPIILIIALVVTWLVANNTLAFGHVLLGIAVSLGMTLGFRRMRPVQPRVKRLYLAAVLILRVLVDIIRSNIGVARIVLGLTGNRKVTSEFFDIPLDMRDPHGLAVLAVILTSTPGTVWAGLAPDGSTLKLHVLDLRDEDALTRLVKHRYERLLMEIFE